MDTAKHIMEMSRKGKMTIADVMVSTTKPTFRDPDSLEIPEELETEIEARQDSWVDEILNEV